MRLSLVAPALLAVALCACGSTTTASLPSPTPSPSPSPLTCTSSGPASVDWPAPDTVSATPPIVSVSVSGDVLTITFAKGTPAFTVTTQSSAHFTMDPSGLPVDVPGNAGAAIRLTGFRGDQVNFAGKVTTTSAGPLLLDVNPIGDFEGVVSFGAGLAKPGCASATAGGSTLTFHFIPAA